jgi:integrase
MNHALALVHDNTKPSRTFTFTDRGVRGLPVPKTGRVDYWDASLPAFGVRVSAHGRKTWTLMYRSGRRLRRLTIGTFPTLALADARERARNALKSVSLGDDPAAVKQEKRSALTFEEIAEEYIERHAKPKKKSWKEDRRMIDSELYPAWRYRIAREIRRRDVLTLIEKIVDRGAPIAANRMLALISKIFAVAVEREHVEMNPATRLSRPAKEKPRERILSKEELRKFWIALDNEPRHQAAILRLRLLTAQRASEIRSIRLSHLDLADSWWTTPKEFAKNSLTHRVPLSRPTRAILDPFIADAQARQTETTPDPLIFPEARVGDLKQTTRRAVKASGVKDVHGRDLRRTAATVMTGTLGVTRLVVAKILNHKERDITAVYDRASYDRDRRVALEAWGDYVTEVVENRDAAQSA